MTLLNIFAPFFFAGAVGFSHAFEADHLIAVSSIVSKRDQLLHAVRDGIYWGLGHTSTIILIGLIMIVGGISIPEEGFQWLEGLVGVMLITLGIFRLMKGLKEETHTHDHVHPHSHKPSLAYSVGLVHGLAGSGALILLVMTEIQGRANMMGYLITFGVGSIFGMMVAAGLFSLPTTRIMMNRKVWKLTAIAISSILCIGYGIWVAGSNFGLFG